MNYLLDAFVSPACYAMVKQDYPKAFTNENHLRLLGYILFTGRVSKSTVGDALGNAGVLLPHTVITECYDNSNENTKALLDRFFTDVHAFPCRDHNWKDHEARVVFPKRDSRYALANRLDETRVHLLTGKPVDDSTVHRAMHEAITEAEATLPDNSPLKLAQTMLNRVKVTNFKIKDQCYDATVTLIKASYDGARQEHWLTAIERIKGQPPRKPIYFKPARTPRIFPKHPLLYLPADIRRSLLPGWAEMDLRAAHLAIASITFNVPALHAFLKAGHDPWELFQSHSGLDRKTVKSIVNPYLNGSGFETMAANAGVTLGQVRQLMAHPLLKALAAGRKKLIATIKKNGQVRLPSTGQVLKLTAKTKELSLIAQLNQDYETQLIAPVFALANASNKLFKILYFQHDGFTFHVKTESAHQQVMGMLQAYVQVECQRLDIPTQLVLN